MYYVEVYNKLLLPTSTLLVLVLLKVVSGISNRYQIVRNLSIIRISPCCENAFHLLILNITHYFEHPQYQMNLRLGYPQPHGGED